MLDDVRATLNGGHEWLAWRRSIRAGNTPRIEKDD
jgi:hypothetical protein